MKIHCSKTDLFRGVQTIQSALSPRTTLPILLNFLMETEQSRVKLISTDLEMGMKHYIPAEVETDGSITIPARKFSEIIQSLQDGQEVDMAVDASGKVLLKSGRSRFSIAGAPKSEYPVLPEIKQEQSFTLPGKVLAEMLRKTVFAASTDETRYVLNGVFWVGAKGELDLVATDGRRLTLIRRRCLPANCEFKVIVPTKVLGEIVRLLGQSEARKEEEQQVRVGVTENQISFELKTTTIISRLVEGSFPNYEQVVPSRKDIKVVLSAADLLAITKRAALCAADRGGSVRYTIKPRVLQVYASSQQLEFDDEIPIEYAGPELAIAFNPQFIVDGLKAIDSEKIQLGLTTPANPVLIEAEGDPDYRYVVMPMRV